MKSMLISLALGALLLASSRVMACQPAALKINMDWLRANNAGAGGIVSQMCSDLINNTTSNRPQTLGQLIQAFRAGQSRNEAAADTISMCSEKVIVSACR